MTPELMLTTETATPQSLQALFDAAMFDTSLDDDGDLIIKEEYRVIVTIENKSYVRLWSIFGFKDDVPPPERYALCNRVNDALVVVRASANANAFILDWYLPLAGGIPKKTVALAVKKFVDILGAVGKHDTENVLE